MLEKTRKIISNNKIDTKATEENIVYKYIWTIFETKKQILINLR